MEEQISSNEIVFHDIPSHKKKPVIERLRTNPWILSTLVLGIIVGIFLINNFYSGVTGNVVSEDEAAQAILGFANSQTGGGVTLINVSEESGLYKVMVDYQNKSLPLYITKDGKNLVQGVMPLSVFEKPSKQEPVAQEIAKSDKPQVELFIMSMCPYGTQAEKGILPVLELLKDKIDFTLRFVSYAMHGKNEIDENTRLYCVQKQAPEKLYDYMKCYLKENDASTWEDCVSEVGIDKSEIDSCISSADTEFNITELFNDKSTWSGGRYPQYNVDKNLNTQYRVQGSPALVVNGAIVSSARSPSAYLNTICNAFNSAPSECSQTLSSENPSPGFGYSASAGSGSSGSCS